MIIRTSEDIRTDYNSIIEECRQTGEPVYLTKNGQGDAVVMDIETFERREAYFRAQQMVFEAYVDQFMGAKSYSVGEVTSIVNELLKAK